MSSRDMVLTPPAQALVQLGVAIAYVVLAKAGLMLAILNPGASAIWPATGLAIAAVLLWGPRVTPAIFVGALIANLAASATGTALMIATGNTLEALVAGLLVRRFAAGVDTFETPARLGLFALIVAVAATPISATVGVAAIAWAGEAASAPIPALWLTWWLGNLGGALVVAPVAVLWIKSPPSSDELAGLLPLLAIAFLAGVVAFGPISATWADRGLFAFASLVPLLWTAVRRNQRDTATVALLLAAVATWGTAASAAAHNTDLNSAFLTTLVFVASTALPSLALSAEVSIRRRAERDLRNVHEALEATVQRRTSELLRSNEELRKGVEQRKILERANEQQRIQLVEAQRIADLGSWSWDARSGVVSWSPQLYEIYGMTPETFGGTVEAFLERVHPDDRKAVSDTVARAIASGTGFRSQERIVRPDGAVRYLTSVGEVRTDDAGNVIELLGICHDVTPQKSTDHALRESEDQLQRLINGIHDYAIFMLDPSGRIVSWNSGAARIKQYTREEAIGKHVSLFYAPEERAARLPEHALSTAAREGRYEGEGWRMRQNGTRFWANVVIDAIYDTGGKLVGFGKITRDVTEKRESQLALDQARDQLTQAQKMETIGQVTGGVAHDFNNLLAALISSLQLLEKRLPADPQAKRLLANALNAAERGASLTQRMLTFARRQDLKPEIVEIPQLLTGMTDLIQRSIGPLVNIETTTAGTRTTARVDPTQLELAIFNLALNARDAMPNGGTLRIEIADEVVSDAKEVDDLAAGRYVRITVADTGAGMDAETLKRAIEPFFTTKGIGKGTGLGLSMVQGLAAQSGGAMKIASEAGAGTQVTIWLPASDQSPAPAVEAQPPTAHVAQHCRVLVVDDDPLVSMGTVAMLEDLGHSAIEVSSGRQALAALESGAAIDVVVTDQAMPGMTGTELIEKIREQHPRLPIILATGWAELPENSVPEFLRLSKPYRQEELDRALRRVLEHHEKSEQVGAP